MENMLHVFTDAKTRDEYFNKVKNGNLVTSIDKRDYSMTACGVKHSFKVIRGVSDAQKLRGRRFEEVRYHQQVGRNEAIMNIESQIWKSNKRIDLYLPMSTALYFNR